MEDIESRGDAGAGADLLHICKGSTPPPDCVKNPTATRYRPSYRSGPPATLFNKALAVLQYDLQHLDAFLPPSSGVSNASNFISRSVDFYDDDDKRKSSLRGIIQALLPGENKWQEFVDNGGLWFEGSFVYLIFELKNEVGLGGDPFLQCLSVYTKIIEQHEYSKFCQRSNLPVILLSMAANHFEVSAAVFADTVYVRKLLALDLYLNPFGRDDVLHAARIFLAINKCTDALRELYKNLPHAPIRPTRFLYPDPSADPPNHTSIPQLYYLSKLDRISATLVTEANYLARMLHNASTGETLPVLVKFTPKYNEVAHRLLANCNPRLAPALHHCVRVVDGMYMVVMEYLSNAKALHTFLSPPSPLPNVKAVGRDLTLAIGFLHQEGFVFGDLRLPNILYSPEDDRAFLTDFDIVGKHQQDRYPLCVNLGLGLGVDRCQVMEKAHDHANLKRVMKLLHEAGGHLSTSVASDSVC